MPLTRFRLNGAETTIDADPDRSLLDVLRGRLGLVLSHQTLSGQLTEHLRQAILGNVATLIADSDDCGQRFRLKPDADSDPRRTVIPMIPSRVVVDVAYGVS